MLPTECYKLLRKLDIEPVLSVMDRLKYHDTKGICASVTEQGSYVPPEVYQLLKGLGLGGRNYRVFFRKLAPYQSIAPHVDEHPWLKEHNIRRFQVPIITHPEIVMRWPDDQVQVHLEAGGLYEVRFDRKHEVINNVPFERVHLQIDQSNATI